MYGILFTDPPVFRILGGSSFSITVVAAAAHGPSCIAQTIGIRKITPKIASTFTVDMYDRFGNRRGPSSASAFC